MKTLAIFGDSFSDPRWTENSWYKSWPELLADKYDVTNFSLSGTSMWWSYKQFKENYNKFDQCIFVPTMPGRVHIESLDRHLNFNETTWPKWFGMNFGELWFKYFYSKEREECFQELMIKEIFLTPNTLVIPAFAESIAGTNGDTEWTLCHYADMEIIHYGMKHAGDNERRKCHLSTENNQMIFNKIITALSTGANRLQLSKEDYVVPKDPVHRYWY